MKETKKLPSQRDNDSVKKRVLAAAHSYFHKRKGIKAFFEHGHWWIEVDHGENSHRGPRMDGFVTYDVVDAEGRGSVNGFGFEEVG